MDEYGEKVFTCRHCSKTFPHKSSLKRHMLGHVSVKPFNCQICGTGFCHKSSFKRHTLNGNCSSAPKRYGIKRPPKFNRNHYQCPACGVGFAHKYAFKIHMITNACEVGKVGASSTLAVPNDESPIFTGQSSADDTIMPQEEIKNVISEVNAVALSEKHEPQSDDKEMCIVCRKVFSSKLELDTHFKEHVRKKVKSPVNENDVSGEGSQKSYKSFACGMCGKTTKTAYGLKAHSLRCTGNAIPQCVVCKKVYGSHLLLRRHMKRHLDKSIIDQTLQDRKIKKMKTLASAHTSDESALVENQESSLSKESSLSRKLSSITTASSNDHDEMTVYISEQEQVLGLLYESDREDTISPTTQISEDPLLDHFLDNSLYNDNDDCTEKGPSKMYGENNIAQGMTNIHSVSVGDNGIDIAHPSHTSPKVAAFDASLYQPQTPSSVDLSEEFQDNSTDDEESNRDEIPTIYIEENTDSEEEKEDDIELLGEIKKPVEEKSGSCADPLMRDSVAHHEKISSPQVDIKLEPKDDDDDQKYTCEICGFLCNQKSILRQHLADHHGENQKYKCSICWGDFLFQSDLAKHMETHEARRYSCHFCSLKFVKKCGLIVHMRTHTDIQRFTCDICKMTFATKTPFLRHRKVHMTKKLKKTANTGNFMHEEKKLPFILPKLNNIASESILCEPDIASESALRKVVDSQRKETHTIVVDPKVRGNSVLKNFTVVYDMDTPKSMSKKYKCRFCGEKFDGRVGLEQHVAVHKTGKSYVKIPSKVDKIHRAGKTLTCNICFKKFNKMCNLARHNAVHRNSPPHVCGRCNLSFSTWTAYCLHDKEHLSVTEEVVKNETDDAMPMNEDLKFIEQGVKNEIVDSTLLHPQKNLQISEGKSTEATRNISVDENVPNDSILKDADLSNVTSDIEFPVIRKSTVSPVVELMQGNQKDIENHCTDIPNEDNNIVHVQGREQFSDANPDSSDIGVPSKDLIEDYSIVKETAIGDMVSRSTKIVTLAEDVVASTETQEDKQKITDNNPDVSTPTLIQFPDIPQQSKLPSPNTDSQAIFEDSLSKSQLGDNEKETNLEGIIAEVKPISNDKATSEITTEVNPNSESIISSLQTEIQKTTPIPTENATVDIIKKDRLIDTFRCDICGRVFSKKSCLVMHSRIHEGGRPYPCLLCEQTFRSAASLHLHMYKHGTPISVKYARKLSTEFRRNSEKPSLNVEAANDKEIPFSTQETDVSRTVSNLGEVAGVSSINSYVNDPSSSNVDDANRSKRVRKSTVRYTDESSVVDIDEFKISCPYCHKRCLTRSALANHIKTHSQFEHFPCKICNVTFYFKDTLASHQRSVHGYLLSPVKNKNETGFKLENEDRLVSDVDQKAVFENVNVKSEDNRIFGNVTEQPFSERETDFIGVSVNEESQEKLGKHIFSCSSCRKTFRHRGMYMRHKKLNSCTLKPFKCQVSSCGMSFKRRFNLKRHMKRHYILKYISLGVKNRRPGQDLIDYTNKDLIYKHKRDSEGNSLKPSIDDMKLFAGTRDCLICGLKDLKGCGYSRHMKSCHSYNTDNKKYFLVENDEDFDSLDDQKHSTNSETENVTADTFQEEDFHMESIEKQGSPLAKTVNVSIAEKVSNPKIKKLSVQQLQSNDSPFSKLTEKLLLKQQGVQVEATSKENLEKETKKSLQKQNDYDCIICGRNIQRTVDFVMHLSFHKDRDELKIDHFESSHLLYELISLMITAPSCDLCRKVFCICKALQLGSDNENFDFCKCDSCDSKFIDKWTLVDHMSSHGRKISNSILIEDMKAYLTKSLEKQSTSEQTSCSNVKAEEGHFQCSICGEFFQYPTEFVVHLVTHDSVFYECSLCQESFKRKLDLDNHLVMHEKTKDEISGDVNVREGLVKSTSDNKFDDKASGIVENIESIGEKESSEELTDIRYSRINEELIQTKEGTYDVSKISDVENVKGDLENNSITSDGKSLNDCSNDGKSTDPDAQESKEGAYVCPICNESFTRYQKLMSHQKLHLEPLEYECEKCKMVFQSKDDYDEHISTHSQKSTSKFYECPICGKKILNPANFFRHYASHTPLQDGENQSSIPFSSINTFEIDIETESSNINVDNQPQQDILPDDSKDQVPNSSLQSVETGVMKDPPSCKDEGSKCSLPLTKKLQKRSHLCNLCGQSFGYAVELKKHLYIHGFTCNMCGHVFDRKSKFKGHVRRHTAADKRCKYCWKRFLRKREFDIHMKTHGIIASDETSNTTIKVGKVNAPSYKKNNVLDSLRGSIYDPCFEDDEMDDIHEFGSRKRKRKTYKGVGKKIHVCPTCGRKYENAERYLEHRKLHLELLKFRCDVCPEKFRTKAALLEHKEKCHEALVLYSCPDCKEHFSNLESFSAHCEKHKKSDVIADLPINTSVQGEAGISSGNSDPTKDSLASNKSYLETSDLSLYDVNQYTCHICGRKCKTLYYLKNHLEVHSENKPFKCHVCHKALPSARRFKRHMASHFRKKRFPCSMCSKVFAYRYVLVRHIQNAHKQNVELALKMASEIKEIIQEKDSVSAIVESSVLKNQDLDTITQGTEIPVASDQIDVTDDENEESENNVEANEVPVHKNEKKKKSESMENVFPDLTLDQVSPTGKKRCLCPLCGKVCSCRSNLNDHIISHASDKPWFCPACDIKFKRLWDRNRHIRNKHGCEPKELLAKFKGNKQGLISSATRYDCSVCSKSFLYDSVFRMHMMFHTGESEIDYIACEEEEYYECTVERNEDEGNMDLEDVVVDTVKPMEFTIDDTEKDYAPEDVAIDIKEEIIDVDDVDDIITDDFDIFSEMILEQEEQSHLSEDTREKDSFTVSATSFVDNARKEHIGKLSDEDNSSDKNEHVLNKISGSDEVSSNDNNIFAKENSSPKEVSAKEVNEETNKSNLEICANVDNSFAADSVINVNNDVDKKNNPGETSSNIEVKDGSVYLSQEEKSNENSRPDISNSCLDSGTTSILKDDIFNNKNVCEPELPSNDATVEETASEEMLSDSCTELKEECKGVRNLETIAISNSEQNVNIEEKKKLTKKQIKNKSIMLPRKNVYCSLCNLTFSTTRQLFGHIHIHSGLVFYQCDVCGETFKNSKTYKEHAVTHIIGYFDCNDDTYCVSETLGKATKRFSCSFCGKSFMTRQQLGGHLHVHSSEFSRSCEDCGESFVSNKLAMAHLYQHLTLLFKGPTAAQAKLGKTIAEPQQKESFMEITEKEREKSAAENVELERKELTIETNSSKDDPVPDSKDGNDENHGRTKMNTSSPASPSLELKISSYVSEADPSSYEECKSNYELVNHSHDNSTSDDSETEMNSSEDLKLSDDFEMTDGRHDLDSWLHDEEMVNESESVSSPGEMDISNCESESTSLQANTRISNCEAQSDPLDIILSSCESEPSPGEIEMNREESELLMTQEDGDSSDTAKVPDSVLKPYSCMYCNKLFKRKDSMRYHMRLHTGDRVLECDVCSKKFIRKSHLQEHEKTHCRV